VDRHFRRRLGGIADMTNSYKFWQSSLAGENPKMFVDQPELGFYRSPIKERDAKGNNKRTGWKAVAVFMHNGMPTARVHAGSYVHDVIGDGLNELWSYIAGNPISEETYRAVAERGEPWPGELPVIPAADREVAKADNSEPERPLDVQHATAVDNAIAAALKAVTNEAEAAQALGSKNRIAELRLAADKAGKAIYDPIYRTYTAEQKKWSPIVARAAAKEKELNTAILTFRERERQRIAAEAAAKQREIDEANAKAAELDIALAELPTEVVEPVIVAPTPIVATYGTRKLKEEVKTFLDTVNDFDAVYTYFKETAEVKAFLTTLATAAVKAGRTVPGTTTRTGLI
jgi:hypothetical protein